MHPFGKGVTRGVTRAKFAQYSSSSLSTDICAWALYTPNTAPACFQGFPWCDASLRNEGCFFFGAGLPKLASEQADTGEETKGAALASQQVFCLFLSWVLFSKHKVGPVRIYSDIFLIPRNVSIRKYHSHVFLSQSRKGRKVLKHTQRQATNNYCCFSLNAPSSMASRILTNIENILTSIRED